MCMVQQCVASLKFLPAQLSPFVEIFFYRYIYSNIDYAFIVILL